MAICRRGMPCVGSVGNTEVTGLSVSITMLAECGNGAAARDRVWYGARVGAARLGGDAVCSTLGDGAGVSAGTLGGDGVLFVSVVAM